VFPAVGSPCEGEMLISNLLPLNSSGKSFRTTKVLNSSKNCCKVMLYSFSSLISCSEDKCRFPLRSPVFLQGFNTVTVLASRLTAFKMYILPSADLLELPVLDCENKDDDDKPT